MAVASPLPATFVAGVSLDQPWQPLAECGADNPFFYHTFSDDFDPYRSTDYTPTISGTGAAIAAVAGDGGIVQFTTGSTAGVISLQRGVAVYTVNSQPKKVFYEARLQMSAWATAGVTGVFGLIQTTTTPGTVTDGVYFTLSAAGALAINSAVGSVITTVAIPTSAYTLTANQPIDIAFYINRNGDVLAYVDSSLVGYITQNLTGTAGNPNGSGPVARIVAPTLTTAVLNPTLALIQAGTTVVTLKSDFQQVQKER